MLHLRLLELRKKKGMTQAEIAKLLRITPQAYSLYESGKNNINNETLCMLADLFHVSTDYLLGRQDLLPSFLNDEERHIIEQYRALDKRAKDGIKNSMDFEYARAGKGKTKPVSGKKENA